MNQSPDTDQQRPWKKREPAADARLLDVGEFCRRYSIGKTKLYREINEGRLRTLLRGNRRFVRVEDAEAWLNDVHVAA
ncbi:helix-turn-helix domain-containing protein [Sphingomonas kyungheensis]|uniref:Helix-turn-helix domain-containing protein n=1 Tax=Sphingomonas kyungheensis TaxID=1069987 RepID=A0ABU8H2M5_9SPHN